MNDTRVARIGKMKLDGGVLCGTSGIVAAVPRRHSDDSLIGKEHTKHLHFVDVLRSS
jgi:hypothetical protein